MVKIVTDSVASIPAEVVRARDIEVVSLFVNRDGREYREADMDVDAFYEDIADMIDNPPTSSQPSQHAMETIFEKAAQAADEVLGVFISSKMSGTFEGAVRSAQGLQGALQAVPLHTDRLDVELRATRCSRCSMHAMRAMRAAT